MKKITLIILVIIFSNCSNPRDNNEINKTTDLHNNSEPIFLGLSANMSKNDFDSIINSSPFDKGMFTIKLNDNRIDFKVNQRSKQILLTYNNVRKVSTSQLDNNSSSNLLRNNRTTIKNLLKVFKKKYPQEVLNLPFQKSKNSIGYQTTFELGGFRINGIRKKGFKDYGYSRDIYRVFQDSLKTIFIGYTIQGEIVNSNKDLEKLIKDSREMANDPNNPWAFMGEFTAEDAEKELVRRSVSSNHSEVNFGIIIEIRYMHNEDYGELFELIQKEKGEFENAVLEYNQINHQKNKNIENNLNEL